MTKLIFFFLFILSLLISSCSSEVDFENGKEQLENMGYTDIKNTGYDILCCSFEDDTFSTGFTAKNKKGETVEGCLCSGALKGMTIRFK